MADAETTIEALQKAIAAAEAQIDAWQQQLDIDAPTDH